jgi:hypothetical protein
MSSPESRRGFRVSVTQLKLSTAVYGTTFTAPDLEGQKSGQIWVAGRYALYAYNSDQSSAILWSCFVFTATCTHRVEDLRF